MNRKAAAAARRRSTWSLGMGMAEQRAWEASGRRDPRDAPIDFIAEQMEEHHRAGRIAYLKVTCSGCGERMIASDPFTIPLVMIHEDCGASTTVIGGGLMVLMPRASGAEILELLRAMGAPLHEGEA